uniref:RNA helicase n=1 Tax=viral metagenome TaxID=1070528 RepID=A0A6C0IFU8_9ZZZZ
MSDVDKNNENDDNNESSNNYNNNNNNEIINDNNNEIINDNNNEIFLDKNAESEISSFEELDLSEELLRGIYGYGFEKPSPIQKLAIRPLIEKRDILAQAQSGTGKTATFAIGSLSIVKPEDNFTQVLVLSPTKELSIQSSIVYKSLGDQMKNLRVQTLYGGQNMEDFGSNDFSKRLHPHVICGCAGRVLDMMQRNRITSRKIKMVILDEADEMLSSGFKEQVYQIFQHFNNNIQVALFSATIPESIKPIVDKIMRNPVKISVKMEQLTLEGISQYYVAIEDDRQKYLALKDIYSNLSVSLCIIYANSVKRVTDLYEAMMEDGFPVCCIHSNMDRTTRENSFKDFRQGKFRVLISSNVTSRGIDIQQVGTVINFDIPKCVHNYLHRIGRSGRWGRKGVGINLITRRDFFKLKEIERHYDIKIKELPADLKNL